MVSQGAVQHARNRGSNVAESAMLPEGERSQIGHVAESERDAIG